MKNILELIRLNKIKKLVKKIIFKINKNYFCLIFEIEINIIILIHLVKNPNCMHVIPYQNHMIN